MAFDDLDQYFDDTLSLPVGGKTYVIAGPDAETGLFCQRLMTAGVAASAGLPTPASMPDLKMDDDAETAFYRRILGDVYDQLVADGVSWPKIQIVAQTAFFWIASGKEMAEAFWRSGGDPKASSASAAPNRASRRSTSTAAARTTKPRASTSGTKSPRKNSTPRPPRA